MASAKGMVYGFGDKWANSGETGLNKDGGDGVQRAGWQFSFPGMRLGRSIGEIGEN